MKHTKVISGFPGIGKSYVTKEYGEDLALDSDSSSFSWTNAETRHPDFPDNYISHIKSNIGKVNYILVSSHKVVRDALRENHIPYTLIYPSTELKDEYLQRYKDRGGDDKFVEFISTNWSKFISDMRNETYPDHVVLKKNQYLVDVLGLEQHVTITRREYDELLKAKSFLECLEACGVDNWDGYSSAREMQDEIEDNS